LVLARGHRIEKISEIPLVVSNETIVDVSKTSSAIKALKVLNVYEDVEKVKDSRKIRRGVGKMRNRRHVQRRGPLIIYDQHAPLTRAFRNIPGVELCNVNRLNLLQLAPGGHLGRLIIWTKSAFERLTSLYGSYRKPSTLKVDYRLPRPVVTNSDLNRLINSQEIQSHLHKKKKLRKYVVHKKNPLRNLGFMIKLNPYAKTLRRQEILRGLLAVKKKQSHKKRVKAGEPPKKRAVPKKKEGKNVRKKITMNKHKKKLVKVLLTNR